MRYKICKFCEIVQGIRPCGAFILHISAKLSKNFNFGGPTPLSLHRWGWNLAWREGGDQRSPPSRHAKLNFGMEEGTKGPLLHAKFHPHRCNVSPLWGEKPQNRPLSKLNTDRLVLHAMLPVNICIAGLTNTCHHILDVSPNEWHLH